MNYVADRLSDLMVEELKAANKHYPPFHSPHEGYAVLLEETEETRDALIDTELNLKQLWNSVKQDKHYETRVAAFAVRRSAFEVAAEAIQVAAMATKLIDHIDEVLK